MIIQIVLRRCPFEAECWDFIINELDKAAKVLPEQWKDKDGINHVGRITKGAAYGLKARAALYAKRWQDAVGCL
ncbi:RagB/SusD family nutrient uptake outer membrane protein [Bacteroides thetaiotaomicron]|uniref:RagB/SusD family nutrient uptake outer membrane protein n=1 Tax=Bacteroides thetaiotaomicron TaxID=818 RepID=UPI00216626BB|nr:RagB/SusD family nutrient uptake outer membrane protein [Bacteroides thetaiotaomicron]MCS3079957.1 RagB/SusD family nutrient uptake outer membrane protein [Bacteroides thetaiotaomicron]